MVERCQAITVSGCGKRSGIVTARIWAARCRVLESTRKQTSNNAFRHHFNDLNRKVFMTSGSGPHALRSASFFRLAMAVLMMLAVPVAFAAGIRSFPGNSVQVQLNQSGNGAIVVNGNIQLKLASGVIIFNERNRTIVRGALPTGITVRLLLNGKEEVQRIWILAQDEIEAKPSLEPLTRQRTRPNLQ